MTCKLSVPAGMTCPECGRDHQAVNVRRQTAGILVLVGCSMAIILLFYWRHEIAYWLKAKHQHKDELDKWADKMLRDLDRKL